MPSPSLDSLQRAFLAAIRGGSEPPPILARAPGAGPRFEAYRRNVAGAWRSGLAGAYPVVERLVGAAFFTELAARYAAAHPSASGDLHRFGDRLAPFIADYAHARSLPYLPDVARLEWAVHRAGFAADPRPFDFDALARVPAGDHERLRFEIHPSAAVIVSRYPVLAIWEANQAGRDGTPDRDTVDDALLVRRDGLDIRIDRLDAAEGAFVAALAAGAPLAEAAAAFGDAAPDRLAPALRDAVARSVIARVIEP